MNSSQPKTLNLSYLKNRINELALKQWWLAEQIGVDRKTVSRWISGQVRSIQPENLMKLATILDCDVAHLILEDSSLQVATSEDQKTAAEAILKSSLIDKLGPIGEWDVIENLLKASLIQDLPLSVLGEIYDKLCIASWRQSKIDQAETYNKKLFEIAAKIDDKALLAKFRLSAANICSWRGQTRQSIQQYQEVLKSKDFIPHSVLAAAYSNLGAVLYETGDLDNGFSSLQKAIECYQLQGTPTNLSIAYGHLAMIELEHKNLEISFNYAMKSLNFAEADHYLRGQYMERLILSEIFARRNQNELAEKYLTEALQGFSKMKIEEGLNYEFAGRITRIMKQPKRSLEYLQQGIKLSEEFPLYQAALYYELCLTEKEMGLFFQDNLERAIQLYKVCEAFIRAQNLEKLMG